ncbi:hypothetical protein AWB67_07404 [Caballeronia terrestris]|jgi:hypothetical protein|uniref:Uncharacterized protein n=1 Tax=Caballeronia terrestris TaxID=1226301 RepID=A0A158L1X9_9BURK|nr:hypothetical protein AWB67_07404 [Caballeronia terrestris]
MPRARVGIGWVMREAQVHRRDVGECAGALGQRAHRREHVAHVE